MKTFFLEPEREFDVELEPKNGLRVVLGAESALGLGGGGGSRRQGGPGA